MKRTNDESSEANTKKRSKTSNSELLQNLTIYILPARFGKNRLKLLQNQVTSNGGNIHFPESNFPSAAVTHVLLEETIDKNILIELCDYISFKNAKFLKCSWLIKSIKTNILREPIHEEIVLTLEQNLLPDHKKESGTNVDTDEYLNTDSNIESEELGTESLDQQEHLVSYETEILGTKANQSTSFSNLNALSKLKDKFACAHSSLDATVSPNKFITDELEKLASAYQNKKDTWRAVGYQKAIAALKNYPQKIETWEEAKNIRGVGQRLADKIKEIIEVGKLRKVAEICENEESRTLNLFIGVWGAGATTANEWYTQGFRTLEDLSTKAKLSRHQKIGLKYYEEINERMDRSEVNKIGMQVREAAAMVKTGLEVIVCGSYRRGKSTCGDVDVLITHPDKISHENIFVPLLEVMRKSGFITDDLVVQEHNGNQQKYLGVCKLPEPSSKHRRLDIIVVPYGEFAPAIMYFTGSAHFNRSMRLLATKMGMSLSEHGLRKNIVRDSKHNISGGILLQTPTEESIFQHLGLEYRAPSERNH